MSNDIQSNLVQQNNVGGLQSRLTSFVEPIVGRMVKGYRHISEPRPRLTSSEEAQIPELLDNTNLNIEDLMQTVEQFFQEKLLEAVKMVSQAKFIDGERGEVDFFEGTGTAVVMNCADAKILAAFANPLNKQGVMTASYEKYGIPLSYVVNKAFLELVLWLDGHQSGVAHTYNHEYLQRIMGDKTVFLGSNATVIMVNPEEGWRVVLAVSLFQGSKALLEAHFNTEHLEATEEFGGWIDQIAANLLAKYLANPTGEPPMITLDDIKEAGGIFKGEELTLSKFRKLVKVAS